jgi:hypothetical protein
MRVFCGSGCSNNNLQQQSPRPTRAKNKSLLKSKLKRQFSLTWLFSKILYPSGEKIKKKKKSAMKGKKLQRKTKRRKCVKAKEARTSIFQRAVFQW